MRSKRPTKKTTQSNHPDRALAAGAVTVSTLNYTTQSLTERPTSESGIHERCRYWEKESTFLQTYLPLKRSIYNAGMEILPTDPGKLEALEKWMEELVASPTESIIDPETKEEVEIEATATNRERVEKFAEDLWNEFFLMGSAVAIWLDDINYATVAPIEKCTYTDTLGIESLRYTHGLTAAQVAILPEEKQERFKKATIPINPKEGEHFKVLKRARVGEGFGVPGLFSIFRLLAEVESKEVGMHATAFFTRRATRQHKLGHKIDSGERAGRNTHFWKKDRSDAVKRSFENTTGPYDFTCNFDHEIEFPWPDLKVFDSTAFSGSNDRLNTWGGPVAHMVIAKGVTPFLAQLLESSAKDDRRKVGTFLASVINLAFQPPSPIHVRWSDLIFKEARLQSELIKFGIQQGIVSYTTGAEVIGVNLEAEGDRKVAESQDPEFIAKSRPHWDQSHALAPSSGETAATMAAAKSTESKTGKPPGTQDKT